MKQLLSILILLGCMSLANANECPNGGMPTALENDPERCIPDSLLGACFITKNSDGENRCRLISTLNVNFLLDKNYSIIDISDSVEGLIKIYTLKKSDDLFICRVNTVYYTTDCIKP